VRGDRCNGFRDQVTGTRKLASPLYSERDSYKAHWSEELLQRVARKGGWAGRDNRSHSVRASGIPEIVIKERV
jgi:hypothetical protein